MSRGGGGTSKKGSLNLNLKNICLKAIDQMYLLENIHFGTHSFHNIQFKLDKPQLL
jgi:hypothetical protein